MRSEIRTSRLLMRRWRDADREPFAAMNADPVVMKHFFATSTREQSNALVDRIEAHFDANGYGLWALEVEGQFVGFTGLSWATWDADFTPVLEVGWRLAAPAWGRGYASEAATAALRRGFQDVDTIVSVTALTNERSTRVMERIGLRYERDFDHPRVPDQHPLRRHALYRADRRTWRPQLPPPVDEAHAAYLGSVLLGGREPAVITVVDYDEAWPAWFEVVAGQVRRALGSRSHSVEHIGSTSVPGLAAKPIIDMLLTVEDVADEAAYVPALEPLGFALRVREAAHRMLRTAQRDVHLHVYEPDRPEVVDYLDLRDWLRRDKRDRALYAATKRRLARQHWDDLNDYADAKTDIVADILVRARAWRGTHPRR